MSNKSLIKETLSIDIIITKLYYTYR